jgi:hypothetical protein
LNKSQLKAIHAKQMKKITNRNIKNDNRVFVGGKEVSPPYGAQFERVNKDPEFKKKMDKMLKERQQEKDKRFKKTSNNHDEIEHTKLQLKMSKNQPLRQQFFKNKLEKLKKGAK